MFWGTLCPSSAMVCSVEPRNSLQTLCTIKLWDKSTATSVSAFLDENWTKGSPIHIVSLSHFDIGAASINDTRTNIDPQKKSPKSSDQTRRIIFAPSEYFLKGVSTFRLGHKNTPSVDFPSMQAKLIDEIYNRRIAVQAQTAIKEGEEININYVPFIQVLELFS